MIRWIVLPRLLDRHDEPQEPLFNLKRSARPDCDPHQWLSILVSFTLVLSFFSPVSYANGGAETATAHISRGLELMQQNRYATAVQEFIAALQIEPDSPEAHFRLGICNFVLGKSEEARQEFETVIHEHPGQPSAIYYLGRLDLQAGNLDGAISRFQQIAPHPPLPDAPFYLGQAYFKRGQALLALRWLLAASQAAPHDPRIQEYLGRVYRKLGREDESEKAFATSEAMRQADQISTQQGVHCDRDLNTKPLADAVQTCRMLFDPQDADKLALLGRLYGQHGFYDLGLEPLKLAATVDPDSYEIQHNLGLTFFRLGEFREAVEPLQKAVRLRPKFFGSNALLGASLLAIGEEARSLDSLRQAHHLHPVDQEVTHMLYSATTAVAKNLIEVQKYSESVPVLREAATLSPGQPEVHALLAEAYARLGRNEEAEQEKRTAQQLSRPGS